MQWRVLDLFSGIGGFALGLERAGMQTVAFCEIDHYARAVLAKHWPHVPCYDDVRTVTADRLRADGIGVDVICGGFPCQPASVAGKRLGREDDRWLWPEYRRLIEECQPAWVIGENVVGIVTMELDGVLADLDALGYASRAFDIPACSVGAPHERRRIWIIANADDRQRLGTYGEIQTRRNAPHGCVSQLADTDSERGRGRATWREDAKDARQPSGGEEFGTWDIEPDVGRVANGVPARVDRLRCLGNAVVPQVVEIIGRAIIESEK